MATQQVKFHSVTEAAYAEAEKQDGSLYFISDNGEIRKGANHVAGTRVFTSTDSTGSTAVDDLTIYLGNTNIANDGAEKPKKGDMLVVKHVLTYTGTEPNLVEDKVEYSAYIYSTNGGAYSASGWQACDGNVDASKVILTSDITMAGAYTQVGNLTKTQNGTSTFATQGKSVAEALQEIFTKKLQPSVTQPSVTLRINNAAANYVKNDVEVGGTFSIPNYAATFNKGAYTYGPDTGLTATWEVTETKGNTTSTSASGSLPSVTATDETQSYTVTATATYGAGPTPKDNLGGDSTVSGIAAGTKSASLNVTVTGVRNWFYGVDTDGTGTIDSTFIRGLTKGGDCETPTEKQFTTGENAVRIVVSIPQKDTNKASLNNARTLSNVILVSASNTPIPDQYNKQSSSVNVEGANGATAIPYDVWIYKPASISPTEIHKLVIG